MPEIFEGTEHNDLIQEEKSILTNQGHGGNDTVLADATEEAWYSDGVIFDDEFQGGSGTDTVSYLFSDQPMMANLGTDVAYRMEGGQVQSTDALDSINGLVGSVHADTIFGSNAANQLLGHGGDDFISGLGGNDLISGDSGADVLSGGSGNDTIDGGIDNDELDGDGGHDSLDGSSGDDDLDGGTGHDSLSGGDGLDTLAGGSGNDVLRGGNDDVLEGWSGNDWLEGGAGDDIINGGIGNDTAVYTAAAGDLVVNLASGHVSGAQGPTA